MSNTGESSKGVGSLLVLRALRHFPCDHRRAENSFRSVVCRFDKRRGKKAHQVALIILSAQTVQQALVVVIFQHAIPEMAANSAGRMDGGLTQFGHALTYDLP